jgi:hypothetical protein
VCKGCGALALDGARISFRALCEPCGIRRQTEAVREMRDKAGPTHDRWRAGMMAILTPADDAEH